MPGTGYIARAHLEILLTLRRIGKQAMGGTGVG